ncbi:hypothetical protein BT96DRAFT_565286 [Gymnopus androsaceus JB14]|uniref:AB hydrolase-1 domain-containing protein n=1 Tax=Gymnopus androsaceus JB14 TaxID=1447944 RepID=A0A6A4GKG7_9AGAR|nr:hypothetical protein BT96DRAFT_565286 [Gymnopus androsaceus JB14]
MIGQSLPEYIFIRICIFLLKLVAPASLFYLFLCLVTRQVFLYWVFPYAVLESSFYVFVYLPRKKRLQKSIHNAPPLDRAQREALFVKCSQRLSGAPDYPLGWFSSNNLKRENVVEWILWALFSCGPEDAQESWNDEIEIYVKKVEELTGMKLEKGRTAVTSSLRLTLDRVNMSHRPFIWYTIVGLVDLITCVRLYAIGFGHYSPSIFGRVFPPRLLTLFSKPSVTEHISYWYRPHKSLNKDPVVFIHDRALSLRSLLKRADSNRPRHGHPAHRARPHYYAHYIHAIPPRREMLDALYTTMNSLGISRAVLASHSYGTVIAAHVIRDRDGKPQSITKPLITGQLLVDPVCLLLHLPNVAFNFLYRVPRRANEWQLWYFASQDPDIAYTLSRCFFWADNILWKDDLVSGVQVAGEVDRPKVAVILSGDDQIIPASAVQMYLTGEEEVKDRWSDGSLEVLYYPGLDHATVFDTKERRRGMIRVLDKFTSRSVDID